MEIHFSVRVYLIFIGFVLVISLFMKFSVSSSVSLSDMILAFTHHKYFLISVNVEAHSQTHFMINKTHFLDKKSKNHKTLHWHFNICF
jgi:hypothetical protein